MAFFQNAPRLLNQYDDDPLLREYLARKLPVDMLREITPEMRDLGELAAGYFFDFQLRDLHNDPVLTQYETWGRRIDHIEVSPLWKEAEKLTAERGLVAVAYERRHGALSRIHQFALNYVVQASLDMYSCPLAMTDGAGQTLLSHQNQALIDRALPHLTSRDPKSFWTSGQWMTERTGGSDVGLSETVARQENGQWKLYGTKWFTSATTSPMALTLARPEGNGPGGRGLALFYVEVRDANGNMNGIGINRLKDKLGTRKVPTAELDLNGTVAQLVTEPGNGIRNIVPMLNVTRTWNAVAAAWLMRRGVALARAYARTRRQFGDYLVNKPLHADTLAHMAAEAEAGFHLAFRAAELMGRVEAGEANAQDEALFRVVIPLAKLTTGKQAAELSLEMMESFGGNGYIEDTGVPLVARDAQVLPLWEGTTNVLSLDTLRAISRDGGVLEALAEDIKTRLATVSDPSLAAPLEVAQKALAHTDTWVRKTLPNPTALETSARRFAMTLGRTLQLALLLEHAQWALNHGHGPRAAAAARLFAKNGVDSLLDEVSAEDAKLLA